MSKPGRPPLSEEERKSAHLSVRIPTDLRDKLVEFSRQSDPKRTLSEEVTYRLQRSFESSEQVASKRFGSTNDYLLFLIIANVIKVAERFTHKTWRQDLYTFRQAKLIISTILNYVKPAGKLVIPDNLVNWPPEPLGKYLAERQMQNIIIALNGPPSGVDAQWDGVFVRELERAGGQFKFKFNREVKE
jgi:hypothetical protein